MARRSNPSATSLSVPKPLAQSSGSQSHTHLHNPLSGLSVPFFGNTSFFPLAGKQLFHSGLYGFGIGTDQFVGALDNGFRTLCIVPQGHAGHAHHGGFLGDPS